MQTSMETLKVLFEFIETFKFLFELNHTLDFHVEFCDITLIHSDLPKGVERLWIGGYQRDVVPEVNARRLRWNLDSSLYRTPVPVYVFERPPYDHLDSLSAIVDLSPIWDAFKRPPHVRLESLYAPLFVPVDAFRGPLLRNFVENDSPVPALLCDRFCHS